MLSWEDKRGLERARQRGYEGRGSRKRAVVVACPTNNAKENKKNEPFETLMGATLPLASKWAPITTGIPLGQRVRGSQLMSGDVGERSGACGGCSASASAGGEPAAAFVEDETDLSATTLGTSSSASPGTTAPLGAWTAAALRMSEVYVWAGRGCADASEDRNRQRRRRPATAALGMRRAC